MATTLRTPARSAAGGRSVTPGPAAVAFGSPEVRRGAAIAAVGTAVPGALGYLVTILGGLIGYPIPDSLGLAVRVTYSPGVGLVLALAGCAAATVAAIRAFQIGGRTAPDRQH